MPSKLILWTLLLSMTLFGGREEDEADQYFRINTDFAASHILVSYQKADSAPDHVRRTKKEAEAKAERLLAAILKDPDSFEAVARDESDGPTAVFGGRMPPFKAKSMTPPFESALKKLAEGEISPKPVKTKFGYHIIRRESLDIKHFGARGILITHNHAQRIKGIPEGSTAFLRTKEQAEAAVNQLAASVNADNFDAMVEAHSDLKESDHGFMGVFKQGDAPVFDQMIGALSGLPYGQISKPLDSPIGYLILQRIKVEKLAASQIWISWLDAEDAPEDVYRLKKEAVALAAELCDELKKNPDRFEKLAEKHSDGPFASRGGLLPEWFVGQKGGVIDRAVMSLPVGGVTPQAVETPYGFYILKRNELR